MCGINNSYVHTAWMMGTWQTCRKNWSRQISPAVWPARCLAHGALESISLSVFTTPLKTQTSLFFSLCPSLALSFSPSVSHSLSLSLNAPLVLWTAIRDAQGCWVKHWTELTGGEGGGGNREELCQSDESRERRQLNLMVAGLSCAAEEM